MNSNISHDECFSVNNVLKGQNGIKEAIKMLKLYEHVDTTK